jgi:aldose 1-epimerase
MISRLLRLSFLLLLLPVPVYAQYSVQRAGDVVQLIDKRNETVVSIVPSIGDLTFEMKVKGQNLLHFPYESLDAFKARPSLAGIPFLGPWANRLDEQAFYANGKKYNFNMSLGNVRGEIPIHGFLSYAPWDVVELKADQNSAWLTSRLDFYRHPDWMAQFPFAQTLELTQRLHNGILEVHIKIQNLSTDPLPVAIGFHPWYQLTDSKREDWTIKIGAQTHYLLQSNKIPSGETEPITKAFSNPSGVALKDYNLDDVFGELVRDSDGRATFALMGKHQKITIQYGPKYEAAVIYSPNPSLQTAQRASASPPRPAQDPNFVCFEPMASITDALNLEHAGKFKGVQQIAPGGIWEESFWVIPSGF